MRRLLIAFGVMLGLSVNVWAAMPVSGNGYTMCDKSLSNSIQKGVRDV